MEWWTVGMVANAVIGVAYFMITGAILVPLVRSGQVRSNPLGAATSAIFFTCAVHHGVHAVHMAMPVVVPGDDQGLAMRAAWNWQLAVWDVLGGLVALYYWSLRRNYGSLMRGAQLFEDLRKREQQALEINDNVLQGLVVAKMSLQVGEGDRALRALDAAITSASHMITELLGSEQRPLSAGLLRNTAATIAPHVSRPPSTAGPGTGPDTGPDTGPEAGATPDGS